MKKVFKNDGSTFSGIYAAEKWCKEQGYTIGSMERSKPIGLKKDCSYISKWSNMTSSEHKMLDGVIEPVGSFRNGDAEVTIY
jgi:hypothetical protein